MKSKKTSKKQSRESQKITSEVRSQSCRFIGIVKTSPVDEKQDSVVEVEINKNEEDLTYDEVEFALDEELLAKFPEEFYPKAEISKIFIEDHESENRYPVVPDDEAMIDSVKADKTVSKFLVLPYAVYSLSPEAKLHLALADEGLVCKDDFDLEMMKRILSQIDFCEKEHD